MKFAHLRTGLALATTGAHILRTLTDRATWTFTDVKDYPRDLVIVVYATMVIIGLYSLGIFCIVRKITS